jgi:hypothetical protein
METQEMTYEQAEEQAQANSCGGNYECKNVLTSRQGSDCGGLCLDCGYDWTAVLDEVDGWDEEEEEEEYDDEYC